MGEGLVRAVAGLARVRRVVVMAVAELARVSPGVTAWEAALLCGELTAWARFTGRMSDVIDITPFSFDLWQ